MDRPTWSFFFLALVLVVGFASAYERVYGVEDNSDTQHTAFVIAIDTYPLAEGGEAYIVRYTLDGAYHAPDFRRHEDVGVFIEHLKKIATVEGLLDV